MSSWIFFLIIAPLQREWQTPWNLSMMDYRTQILLATLQSLTVLQVLSIGLTPTPPSAIRKAIHPQTITFLESQWS